MAARERRAPSPQSRARCARRAVRRQRQLPRTQDAKARNARWTLYSLGSLRSNRSGGARRPLRPHLTLRPRRTGFTPSLRSCFSSSSTIVRTWRSDPPWVITK